MQNFHRGGTPTREGSRQAPCSDSIGDPLSDFPNFPDLVGKPQETLNASELVGASFRFSG